MAWFKSKAVFTLPIFGAAEIGQNFAPAEFHNSELVEELSSQ